MRGEDKNEEDTQAKLVPDCEQTSESECMYAQLKNRLEAPPSPQGGKAKYDF